MPGTQKALFLESKFGEFNLRENEIPTPGPGQLLVKHEVSALNPVDWKIQKLGMFVEDFPALIGTDIAGVVEELGEGVSGYAKGDKVYVTLASPSLIPVLNFLLDSTWAPGEKKREASNNTA